MNVRSFLLIATLCVAGCGPKSPEGGDAKPKGLPVVDETAVIQTLRTIATAEEQARASSGAYADFVALNKAGFLDERFAAPTPVLRGYRFTITLKDTEFSVNADPQTAPPPGVTRRHFYLGSADNVIHFNATQTATSSDPTL